ncbi:stage VI sporulation protein F [Guptibacillus algicola]|uniref:stage VI sporulation protein F n=1 Tax=Guptibacillus algicola TaxID=225844 RepID=UPI001CD665C9|nr:stage VI sporulation protein F [Alkalihalobacillus algicola]MCA0985796.1 stage VI sporulation protein F [Alkalihalobacillus algicola]
MSDLFDNIEKKTNVKKEDIFKLADSVQGADFSDERTVRRLIANVARVANVTVTKEKEDRIVKAIVNKNIPLDFASIAKLFSQK